MGLASILSIVWFVGIVVTFYNGTLFALHPILMSFGFGVVLVASVEQIQKAKSLPPKKKVPSLNNHMSLNFIAVLAIVIVGAGSIMLNKYRNGKPHFVSTHAYFGILTIVCLKIAIVSGYVPYMRDLLTDRIGIDFHRVISFTMFILAICTMISGFETPSQHKGTITYVLEATLVVIYALLFIPNFALGRIFRNVGVVRYVIFVLGVLCTSELIAGYAGNSIDWFFKSYAN